MAIVGVADVLVVVSIVFVVFAALISCAYSSPIRVPALVACLHGACVFQSMKCSSCSWCSRRRRRRNRRRCDGPTWSPRIRLKLPGDAGQMEPRTIGRNKPPTSCAGRQQACTCRRSHHGGNCGETFWPDGPGVPGVLWPLNPKP